MDPNIRAPLNRTITLNDEDRNILKDRLVRLTSAVEPKKVYNRTICQDLFTVLPYLPSGFVDLLILDPPYNLNKSFNGRSFKTQSGDDYAKWIDSWLSPLRRILKPTATIYICCDWRSSTAIYQVATRYFIARNRITWEREKGRGAERNWKNCL